jgi:hypothetical protein
LTPPKSIAKIQWNRTSVKKGLGMRTRVISAVVVFLLSTILVAFAPGGAIAQNYGLEYRGWGLRGGFSSGPDQVFFGGHLDLGEFAPGWHFIPNADLGVGDHETLFSINPDVTYHFPVKDIGALYAGGLFAIQWWHLNDVPRYVDDTESKIGLHAIGGLILDQAPVMFELNVGLLDAPDIKLGVGYTFSK